MLRNVTAKLNEVDPQAWLADVLARIAELSQSRLDELLPWTWRKANIKFPVKNAQTFDQDLFLAAGQ